MAYRGKLRRLYLRPTTTLTDNIAALDGKRGTDELLIYQGKLAAISPYTTVQKLQAWSFITWSSEREACEVLADIMFGDRVVAET